MLAYNFSHDGHLVVLIALYVSLQSLFGYEFVLEIFDLNQDLKGVPFKDHELISKVVGMLVDWDPNVHSEVLARTHG